MKLIISNGKVIGTATDDHNQGEFIDAPNDYNPNLNYTYVNGVLQVAIPQSLTPRQARLALLQATLLDEVEAILTTNKEMQIWWEYSLDIQRYHPHIIAMATSLGITESQLDDLFILGSTL